MNSDPRSYGKIFPFLIYRRVLVAFMLVIGFIGCSSESKKSDKSKNSELQEVEKIYFKSESKYLRKLSRGLSEGVRQGNDDLVDIMGEMTVVKKDPHHIRSRFYSKARGLRKIHRKKMNHLRKKFKKRQKKNSKVSMKIRKNKKKHLNLKTIQSLSDEQQFKSFMPSFMKSGKSS